MRRLVRLQAALLLGTIESSANSTEVQLAIKSLVNLPSLLGAGPSSGTGCQAPRPETPHYTPPSYPRRQQGGVAAVFCMTQIFFPFHLHFSFFIRVSGPGVALDHSAFTTMLAACRRADPPDVAAAVGLLNEMQVVSFAAAAAAQPPFLETLNCLAFSQTPSPPLLIALSRFDPAARHGMDGRSTLRQINFVSVSTPLAPPHWLKAQGMEPNIISLATALGVCAAAGDTSTAVCAIAGEPP